MAPDLRPAIVTSTEALLTLCFGRLPVRRCGSASACSGEMNRLGCPESLMCPGAVQDDEECRSEIGLCNRRICSRGSS